MKDKTLSAKDILLPETYGFAKKHGLLLVEMQADHADVIHKGIPSSLAVLEMRRFLKRPLELKKVSDEQFADQLARIYAQDVNSTTQMAEDIGEELDLTQLIEDLPTTQDLLENENDAPIIRLLNALFREAIKQSASDIHFEVFEDTLAVRFRIDGILNEVLKPQRVLAPLIISRIKVMAKLDIAEKRLPQDGRITLKIAGHSVDVRVSTMPSAHGERVVLRLLDKKAARLDLHKLGMRKGSLRTLQRLIKQPHGIILVTGPTGSGKTTTLYAALTDLNDVSRNILTVEDPIEYYLKGIGQTQVNTKVDMTFAKGLRAILRQDPDVVMVGEIRDLETAEIAVQASLTGHLVLSTLHTNNALGAITRLHDMGVEPFLLSSSLVGVVAQRLVRVLCPYCKREHDILSSESEVLDCVKRDSRVIYQAVGCERCNYKGYSGRTGIYEAIEIDEKLRTMIHEHASEQELEATARQTALNMRQDGCHRVLVGDTSLEEVLRVTSEV